MSGIKGQVAVTYHSREVIVSVGCYRELGETELKRCQSDLNTVFPADVEV